jgi:hypothetical protein
LKFRNLQQNRKHRQKQQRIEANFSDSPVLFSHDSRNRFPLQSYTEQVVILGLAHANLKEGKTSFPFTFGRLHSVRRTRVPLVFTYLSYILIYLPMFVYWFT